MNLYDVKMTQGANDDRPLGTLIERADCIEVALQSPHLGLYNNLTFRASNLLQTDKLLHLIIDGLPDKGQKSETISVRQSIVKQLCFPNGMLTSPHIMPCDLEEWLQVHKYLLDRGFSILRGEILWERQDSHLVGNAIFINLKFTDTRKTRAYIKW